jgi:acyl dehydratase
MFQGKWYEEVAVGERFGTRVTVTETHLVLGSGMFGDFNPLHVDEEQWTVVERIDKPKQKGGILVMRCESRNQKAELAVEAEAKLLVASRPAS